MKVHYIDFKKHLNIYKFHIYLLRIITIMDWSYINRCLIQSGCCSSASSASIYAGSASLYNLIINLCETENTHTQFYICACILLAESLWVFLHLFQDHAHGRVTHYLLHFWISHGPPLHILRAIVPHGLTYHAALNPLSGFLHTHKQITN